MVSCHLGHYCYAGDCAALSHCCYLRHPLGRRTTIQHAGHANNRNSLMILFDNKVNSLMVVMFVDYYPDIPEVVVLAMDQFPYLLIHAFDNRLCLVAFVVVVVVLADCWNTL